MVVNQKQREDPMQCIKASLASPKIVSSYIHIKTKVLKIPGYRIIEKSMSHNLPFDRLTITLEYFKVIKSCKEIYARWMTPLAMLSLLSQQLLFCNVRA